MNERSSSDKHKVGRGYCARCGDPILHHTSYCQGKLLSGSHLHKLMCEVHPCVCIKILEKLP